MDPSSLKLEVKEWLIQKDFKMEHLEENLVAKGVHLV